MTYYKPEILVLGDASRTIQQCANKPSGAGDSNCTQKSGTGSAYDLDE
jgi:hypothetical protein